jgi:hypothetical protein
MSPTEPKHSGMNKYSPLLIIPPEIPVEGWILLSQQVADLMCISTPTLRGWLSRQQFPKSDGALNGKTPYWKVASLLIYLQNAPGGRVPYTVE